MGSAFIGKAKVRVALYSAGTTFENRPFAIWKTSARFNFVLPKRKRSC
jgi:hypothetical protein